MCGGMPYQLEKGPYFSVTESVLDDIDRRIAMLALMRDPATLTDDLPSLDSTSLDVSNAPDKDDRFNHQNVHWFGKTKTDGQGWEDQPDYDCNDPDKRTTGYWHDWYGDAEGIVNEAFIRAIEVSLGIPHEPLTTDVATIKAQQTRAWPIEVFWRCPAPWFEAWVTWRGAARGEGGEGGEGGDGDEADLRGHVTVHFHTPSHSGSALLMKPKRTPPDSGRAEYGEEPPVLTSEGERGMWVIAHEEQQLVDDLTCLTVGANSSQVEGEWKWGVWDLFFGGHIHSVGDIVVVRPNEPDGGVLAAGRPYSPPPPPNP